MTSYANVNGAHCLEVTMHIPSRGPLWADVIFEEAPEFTGQVTLSLGDATFLGTLAYTGTFGAQRRARFIGGGGGWGTLMTAQHYHNDAGVRALDVAQDAARLSGESLGTFTPSNPIVGFDYVRTAGAASRVLEDVIGDDLWWVGRDGLTHVGARASAAIEPDFYEVLDFDPRQSLVTLAVDDLTKIDIGSVISQGLDSDQTIQELEFKVQADQSRVVAWTGASSAGRGRLAKAMTEMIDRRRDEFLAGTWRYRVIQMSGDRVELQAVAPSKGIPDVIPVSMMPGAPGVHATLPGSQIVLVTFLEGDRTLPRIVGFDGKDGEVPGAVNWILTATGQIHLGSENAVQGVPFGAQLETWLNNHTHDPGLFVAGATPVTGTSGTPIGTSPPPSSKVFVE